jgi:uncharacterized protein YjbI with pentapeptide repeats
MLDKAGPDFGEREPVANDEHLALLRQGTAAWNEWRERHPFYKPDLGGAELSCAHLTDVNLSGANLSRANLSKADLSGANLSEADLSRAKLSGTNLIGADFLDANLQGATLRRANLSAAHFRFTNLSGADLSGANLLGARLRRVDLLGANLSGASLQRADLWGANLSNANLSGADLNHTGLFRANLMNADLSGADLRGAYFLRTIIGNVDLRHAIGLDEIEHFGPSIIDFHTLHLSGDLPRSFLRGCGLADIIIEYLSSLYGCVSQFYSCFISYSGKDQAFADRLHADLQDKGVRCWFAPHDLPIGAKTWDAIDEAIRLREKLLLILSKASIASEWVEDEVNKAYAEERSRKEIVLFPIRIDDAVISTAEPWAVKLRDQRNIGDFCQWKKPAEYQKSLDRLLLDLKASATK